MKSPFCGWNKIPHRDPPEAGSIDFLELDPDKQGGKEEDLVPHKTENQNPNHNTRKVSLGPNTKR